MFKGIPTKKVKCPKEREETKYILAFHAEGKKHLLCKLQSLLKFEIDGVRTPEMKAFT